MTVGYVPLTSRLLPAQAFEAFIGRVGQRVSWVKSHGCPCVWTQAPGGSGRLSTPGSAQKACLTCLGVGIYWDAPSTPFQAAMSFMHLSPSPDEPGVVADERFGAVQMSEPSLTLPYQTPYLASGDAGQPTLAWLNASTDDMFIAIDMTARYTAMLQVSGQQVLPFQQNLSVASSGAVVVWNPATRAILPVSGYVVSGAAVTISGYPSGTAYMVEFNAAALYVAYRRAGGLPHIRPLGAGTVNEPKRFRLQALDFWTRQRNLQPTVSISGTSVTVGPYG